jgi:hypothetical protein
VHDRSGPGRGRKRGLRASTAGGMAGPRDGLMAASPSRPAQPGGLMIRWGRR